MGKAPEEILNSLHKRASRCPYCGFKIPATAMECGRCKLTKKQIATASNKEAKRIIKEKTGEKVVLSKIPPTDVDLNRLLILSLPFIGWWGCHCFSVGRNLRGALILASMSFYLICFFILHFVQYDPTASYYLNFVGAFAFLVCMFDTFNIFLKRFKIPVKMGGLNEKPKYTE
ncbi:MAG: hypothetical protein FWD32_00425 [Firmicutes bacterium]|nr:hypothetical protein [Bacillota bacterium]